MTGPKPFWLACSAPAPAFTRAFEILSGRRALTLEKIRTLAKEWRMPAAALLEIEAA